MESLILDTDFQKWMDEQDALEAEMILEEIRQQWKEQVVVQQHEDLEDDYLLMQHAHLIEGNFRSYR